MSTISARSWCAADDRSAGETGDAPAQRQDRRDPRARRARHPSRSARCSTPGSMCSASISATARTTSTARASRRSAGSSTRPGGRSAFSPICKGQSCASAPSPTAGSSSPPAPISASTSIRARATRRARRCRIPRSSRRLQPGTELLLDDGKVRLKAESCGPDFAETVCRVGGPLSDRKGVNVPNAVLPIVGDHRQGPRRSRLRARPWRRLDRASRLCSAPTTSPKAASSSPAAPGVMVKLEKPAAIERLDGDHRARRRG